MHRRLVSSLVVTVAGALIASAVVAPIGTAAPKKQPPLRILVTNDDGYAAPGIDALVEGLRDVPGVKVAVIAPAENKSGTGSSTTPVQLTATDVTTASGYPAVAVAGFPADTIVYALEQGGLAKEPHLVVSGINSIQNLGSLADQVSGTVGAAKVAAARGIPALAVSQGTLENGEPDYPSGVKQALRWLKQHRKALTPKKGTEVEVTLDNLNIPSCGVGVKHRGLAEVPLAGSEVQGAIAPQNCASTAEDLPNDIEAFNNGFVTLTELPVPAS
jgi:5'-nucleotidase